MNTKIIYLTYFSMGLFGGFGHCLGMCGPIIVAWTGSKKASIGEILLYNTGRISSYVFLGMIASILGFIGTISGIREIQRFVIGGFGVVMMIGGGGIIGSLKIKFLPQTIPSSIFKHLKLKESLPLGIANGFFPCALVYTALAGVAGSGANQIMPLAAVLKGALSMFFFGIGTSISIITLGFFASIVEKAWRVYFYKFSAVLMILVGGWLVWRAIQL